MRPRRRAAAPVALVFLLSLAGCRPDAPPKVEIVPRENGSVVFLAGARDELVEELYSVSEDGEVRQLTDDGLVKTATAASPDGSKLAYAAIRGDVSEDAPAPALSSIYVIGADGTDRTTLCEMCSRTAFGLGYEPSDVPFNGEALTLPDAMAWSPDGTTIAAPAAELGVLLLDVDTHDSGVIETPEPVTSVAWSRDGHRLALGYSWFPTPGSSIGAIAPKEGTQLGRGTDGRGGLAIADVVTHEVQPVLPDDVMASVHGWSLEGDVIAFTRLADGRHAELSGYGISEARTWPLVPGERGAAQLGARWSPVEDRIASLIDQYDEETRTAKDLWVVPSSGRDPRSLPLCEFKDAFDGDNCAQPAIAWSPDGTMIAYRAMAHGTPARSVLVLQGIEGSPPTLIEISEASFDIARGSCCLVWLPAQPT